MKRGAFADAQRNIANQIHADDWSAQAVVEYATGHLDVEHVIVVGHTNCGGAAAAFAAPNPDASANATETPENMCPGNSSEGEGKGHGDGHGKGPKEPKEKEQKGSHGRGDGTPVEGQCACFTPDQVEPGTEPGLDQFLAPLIRLRHSLPAGATVQDLIVANVRQSVDVLASSNAITNQWLKQKRVCVHGWLYDIGTGLLKDLEFSRCE